jgi:glycoprotease/Kae1 family metallohydrolase
MPIIGIESSAHTFGVGIVENGRILSNEKSVYPIGNSGMIPIKVAEFHKKSADEVILRSLERADVRLKDISGIGYTMGPGIGPCLKVGMSKAKAMANELNVDIVPLNHGMAHVEIAKRLSNMRDPLALYVSGGNSQILKLDSERRHYLVLGETFDIGVGNMLDSFARKMGLDPAWGSSVAKTATGGRYIKLPYTVKGMDFAFAGLMTKAVELSERNSKKDVSFSLQETAFAMLCEATERALLLTKSREFCVCGGVAQSERLRVMLESVAKEHKIKFGAAPNEFNADNGAMIALLAERVLKRGYGVKVEDCDYMQRYRINDVEYLAD